MISGLLTFHHTTNFGASLQAYALRKQVEMLTGQCEIIDYQHPLAVAYYKRHNLHSRMVVSNIFKSRAFDRFARSCLHLSPRLRSVEEMKAYTNNLDLMVVGSDQVWDCVSGMRGWSPEYLLDFAPDSAWKIAYAPSCGTAESFGDYEVEVSRCLSRIDMISARDRNTQQVVERLTGRRPELVLDPTFLCDFSELTPKERKIDDSYLLYYAALPKRCAASVHKFAKNLGLKVVSLASDLDSVHRKFEIAGPQEFLRLFQDASFVVTTYFHGTIFSILNQIPFASVSKPEKRIKVPDLLDRLGLGDRMLTIDDFATDFPSRLSLFDPLRSQSLVYSEVESSRAFLASAVQGRGGIHV